MVVVAIAIVLVPIVSVRTHQNIAGVMVLAHMIPRLARINVLVIRMEPLLPTRWAVAHVFATLRNEGLPIKQKCLILVIGFFIIIHLIDVLK